MAQVTIRRSRSGRKASRSAIALVWTTIMLLGLLGVASLAVDMGYAMVVRQQLQQAADAGALAGVFHLRTDTLANVRAAASQAAKGNYAAKVAVSMRDNSGNAADGDVVIGQYDQTSNTFTPGLTAPNAVKVVTRRSSAVNGSLPLLFAKVLGVNTVDLQRTSIAMINAPIKPAILILDPTDSGVLHEGGNPTIDIVGGDVVVNSTNAGAVSLNGNAKIIANNTYLMPAAYANSAGQISPSPVKSMTSATANPLSSLAPPDWQSLPSENMPSSGTYSPSTGTHYYKNGLSVGSNKTLTITTAGVYVLGSDLSLQAGGTLTAHGSMFYLVNGATVSLKGHPTLDISGPTSGTYQGISIWQATGDTSAADFGGSSTLKIQGTMYFPSAQVSVGGTADSFSNQLIAWQVSLQGNATINITYSGFDSAWACLVQ